MKRWRRELSAPLALFAFALLPRTLLWATLSAWSVLRYARTLKWSWFMLAVFALSVAVITRWAMALLAVPWTLAVLVKWRGQWSAIGWRCAWAWAMRAWRAAWVDRVGGEGFRLAWL